LPHEDIIYLGDTARVPYGPRAEETIKRFSEENTRFLLSKKVKLIVIACNTASAMAGAYLKNKYKEIQIFEVISPASKEAAKSGKYIGVIGTRGTISNGAYEKSIKKYLPKAKIWTKACPLFVPIIEEGEAGSPAMKLIVKDYLGELKTSKIDTLIMGCTHYPIIKNLILKEVGKKVKIIDPGIPVAKEVSEYLIKNKMENDKKTKGNKEFYVTDITARFAEVGEMFLGENIKGKLKKASL
jgi:glutamate racemase